MVEKRVLRNATSMIWKISVRYLDLSDASRFHPDASSVLVETISELPKRFWASLDLPDDTAGTGREHRSGCFG
jgi:hypothetical protein